MRYLQPAQSFVQQRVASKPEKLQLPPGVSIESVNIGDVPAQVIRAPGAVKSRYILYLHGGGFVLDVNNSHRLFGAALSQATKACVLLPQYRLAPEHPFPAPLDDCLAAYRWLLQQGVAASHIVVAGESAGGNLTAAVPLALRKRGELLPAALVMLSPQLDLAMTGESYTTKQYVDPVAPIYLIKEAIASYTQNGATDVRDPLASPFYADLRGMPPTLIQVGTQEDFLSDSVGYATRARAAGVNVKLEVWPGMWHAFLLTGIFVPLPEASLGTQHIVKHINRYMGR